jgi:lipopolysaccharide export system permease protein
MKERNVPYDSLPIWDYSAGVNRAERYIFRQLFWWTVVIAASLTCVVWLTQSLRFVEMIINRGASAPIFLYLTLLLLPTFLSLILPIATFTAVMFGYNKMILDSELVVLRASGWSQFQLARPAIILAALFTLVGYILTIFLIPSSYREFKGLQFQLRNSYSTVILQEGVFNSVMKGVTVYIRDRSPNGELLGILIHDNRKPAKPVTMMAERGAIVAGVHGPRVVMANGNRQEIQGDDGWLSLLYFDNYTFELSGLVESPETRQRDSRERYLHELFFSMERADEIWDFQKLRMEGHHRLTSPLLGLAFVLSGLAFLLAGDFNRRGQMKRIVPAVAAVVGIEAAMLAAKSYGEKVPEFGPLMYAIALLPILFGGYALLHDRKKRRRPAPPATPPTAPSTSQPMTRSA